MISATSMNPIPNNRMGQPQQDQNGHHRGLPQHHLNHNTLMDSTNRYRTDSQKFLVPSLPISSMRDGSNGAIRRMKERSIINGTVETHNAYHNNGRSTGAIVHGSHISPQHNIRPKDSPHEMLHHNATNYSVPRSSMPIPCSSPAPASSPGSTPSYSPHGSAPADLRMYSPYQQAHAQAQAQAHLPAFFAAAAAAAAAHYPIFGITPYPHSQSTAGVNPYLDNFHSTLLAQQQQFQQNKKISTPMNRTPASYYQNYQGTTTTSLHTKLIESVATSNDRYHMQQHNHNNHTHQPTRTGTMTNNGPTTPKKSVEVHPSVKQNWNNQTPSMQYANMMKINQNSGTNRSNIDKLNELQNHNPYPTPPTAHSAFGQNNHHPIIRQIEDNEVDFSKPNNSACQTKQPNQASRNGYSQKIVQQQSPSPSSYAAKNSSSLNGPKVSFRTNVGSTVSPNSIPNPIPKSPKRILQTQNQNNSSSQQSQIFLPPLPVEQMPLLHAFKRGSPIQLATGGIKSVENLTREDFVQSVATMSDSIRIVHCTLQAIHDLPKNNSSNIVTYKVVLSMEPYKRHVFVDVTPEQPFFILGRGWSSISPETTEKYLQLPCSQLKVGDICITLSRMNSIPKPSNSGKLTGILKTPRSSTGSSSSTSGTPPRSPNIKHPTEQQNANYTPHLTSGSKIVNHTANNGSMLPPPDPNLTAIQNTLENRAKQIPRKRRWSAPEEPAGIEKERETKKSKSTSPPLTT